MRQPLSERLWGKIRRGGDVECWIWAGGKNGDGYGTINVNGTACGAHRVVWIETHGPIPQGLEVCHRCDTPACCNPDHLFLGTHLENIADRVAKGRDGDHRGERHGKAKLTNAQILEMRRLFAAGCRNIVIARKFGLEKSHCHAILRRKLWRHI